VGEVEQVVLRRAPDGKVTEAIATLVIQDRKVVLRESDTFRLPSLGLLDNRFVDIDPGPSGSPPLRPGATVNATIPPTIAFFDAKNLSSFFGLLELSTRMNSLPPEKRDAIMKEFHAMVDKALEEHGGSTTHPAMSGTKR
jgi:hypothetical protein